ncbi:hypothetical protein DOY81_000711 [Sarcophaga bullata]|nr:hypothetical protein DOY81_000711 [Sarcophaga bullata]
MNLYNTNNSSSRINTSSMYFSNIFTTIIAIAFNTTFLALSLMSALNKTSSNAASILSSTAVQCLQQHPNAQLLAATNISDRYYASFQTNLIYFNSNIFIPATTVTAIEHAKILLEPAPQLSNPALVKVYVLSVMVLFSLLDIVFTMWNIYKTSLAKRNLRQASWIAIYSLIFHLYIGNVLVTGFCIIDEAACCYTVQWLANDLTCKLVSFEMFSLYLSTFVLVLIGVNGCIGGIGIPPPSVWHRDEELLLLDNCTFFFGSLPFKANSYRSISGDTAKTRTILVFCQQQKHRDYSPMQSLDHLQCRLYQEINEKSTLQPKIISQPLHQNYAVDLRNIRYTNKSSTDALVIESRDTSHQSASMNLLFTLDKNLYQGRAMKLQHGAVAYKRSKTVNVRIL